MVTNVSLLAGYAGADYRVGRAGLFASKPAPTVDLQCACHLQQIPDPLWERACSRRRTPANQLPVRCLKSRV
ncbi:hypothetical protein C1894_26960 [Pseudomonas sp. FW305-3-2-15-E-TSA2]|nr:hypothetical protein C1895_19565 [Pseudomonas sp. FW305-3-2-15-E-TSA4]POA33687.1 hypothetical protein C1894_26960 [Pseudomonas sp. FW305-3-2-15-E-TSA2]